MAIKRVSFSLFIELFVLLALTVPVSRVFAQQTDCEVELECELPQPSIVLTGIQPEGKGLIIGTTFDPLIDSDFRVIYYVGGAYGDGCFESEGQMVGEYISSVSLSNFPVPLDGVDPSSIADQCIYARVFIFAIETEVGPSNQVRVVDEDVAQNQIPQTGVLGTSTTTPQVQGATLVETGDNYSILYVYVGICLILLGGLSLKLNL